MENYVAAMPGDRLLRFALMKHERMRAAMLTTIKQPRPRRVRPGAVPASAETSSTQHQDNHLAC
jgi:hypothetical protein